MKAGSFIVLCFVFVFLVAGCVDQLQMKSSTCSDQGVVCGIDNKEYSSECAAKDAGVGVAYKGNCIKCKDYDDGKIASESSYVIVNNKRFDDYCADNKNLVEYYCSSNTSKEAYKETIDCSSVAGANACKDGKCVSIVCKDDDGKDIYKKTASFLDGESKTDYCVNMSEVVEYFCDDVFLKSQKFPCPKGYGCSDGACIPVCISTVSSSKFFDFYVKDNVTKGNETFSDYCANATHSVEYYCENNNVKTQVVKCPSGYRCVDGACSLLLSCVDSDGGIDIYSFGSVIKNNFEYKDYCVDPKTIIEYYCSGDNVISVEKDCPSGYSCSGGRCVKLADYCMDSDNGMEIYVKGQTENASVSYSDYCVDSKSVKEYYCSSNNRVLSETIVCPTNYECLGGRCIKKQPPHSCTDSDGGDELGIKGTVIFDSKSYTDYCIDYFHLIEYACVDNNLVNITYTAGSMQECYNGELIPAQCYDPDESEGDNAYFIKTTVRRGKNLYAEDKCIDNNKLVEYTCSANYIAPVTIICDVGCEDGACIIPRINFP
ncbi:MAG: hypothetical protein QXF35_00265 [Candidatus Bilamarchaeaceae archaeon]